MRQIYELSRMLCRDLWLPRVCLNGAKKVDAWSAAHNDWKKTALQVIRWFLNTCAVIFAAAGVAAAAAGTCAMIASATVTGSPLGYLAALGGLAITVLAAIECVEIMDDVRNQLFANRVFRNVLPVV